MNIDICKYCKCFREEKLNEHKIYFCSIGAFNNLNECFMMVQNQLTEWNKEK